MENIEIVNSELQSEILSEQPSNGHCSNTQQNEIETVEVKKVEELISDEEIDLRYASSLDSETDGSWERPQQFGKNYIFSVIFF